MLDEPPLIVRMQDLTDFKKAPLDRFLFLHTTLNKFHDVLEPDQIDTPERRIAAFRIIKSYDAVDYLALSLALVRRTSKSSVMMDG